MVPASLEKTCEQQLTCTSMVQPVRPRNFSLIPVASQWESQIGFPENRFPGDVPPLITLSSPLWTSPNGETDRQTGLKHYRPAHADGKKKIFGFAWVVITDHIPSARESNVYVGVCDSDYPAAPSPIRSGLGKGEGLGTLTKWPPSHVPWLDLV